MPIVQQVAASGSRMPPPKGVMRAEQMLRNAAKVRSSRDVQTYLDDLKASLDTMNPELAFKQCCQAFDTSFFQKESDSDFKRALVFFLTTRYNKRYPLWEKLLSRDSSVLHLL